VYDHYVGGWIAPRRWVRYDGAPEDLALVLFVAVPVTYVASGVFVYVVRAAVLVSVAHTAFRRAVVPAFERIASVSLGDGGESDTILREDDSDKTL